MESYFQKIPSDELIENKQPPAGSDSGADDTAGKDPAEKAAGSDKKKDLDQAEKAGKEEE